MSLHPSLRIDSASSQQRSVLSRIERIKDLMKKGQWKDDRQATGLPKTKVLKIKAKKKTKDEAATGVAGATGAAPAAKPAAGAKASAVAKPAAGAKK